MPSLKSKLLAVVLALLLPAVLVAAEAKLRDLHITGSQEAGKVWLLQVLEDGIDPIPVYTDAYGRLEGSSAWELLYRVPTVVSDATAYGENLAVLLADGQWLILGQSTGRALPDRARILALAGSASDLWALGAPGAMPATTQATTQPATTRPATLPAVPPRLSLYRLQSGGWTHQADLPESLVGREVVLGASMDRPLLASLAEGQLTLWQFTDAGDWAPLASTALAPSLTPHDLLEDGGRVFVYLEGKSGPAQLLTWAGQWSQPLALEGDAQVRAFGLAGGRLRYVYSADGKLTQRLIDPRTLEIDGPDQPLIAQPPADWRLYYAWFEWIIMAIIVIIMIHTYRKRAEYQRVTPDFTKVQLAPFGQRIFAGIVDGVPLLVGMLYTRTSIDRVETVTDIFNSPAAFQILAISAGVWILHTTLFEVIFGRSLGKMLTHLRVVRIDGSKPSVGALLLRNLLRIIDITLVFTLLLVLYLPLRQRIGDLAASTTVVADRDPNTPQQ